MDQVLYHYCSTQAGFAILQSRTFRLSPLSAANDSLEGRVLSRVFSKLLRETGLPQGVADVASIIVEGYADSTEGFAFCLSEAGDLLSQWRAYARDGTGIAIAFSSEYLARDYGSVNFGKSFYELAKVKYGEDALRDSLVSVARQVEEEFGSSGEFVSLKPGITRQDALRALADADADNRGLFLARDRSSSVLLSRLLGTLGPLHFKIYETKSQSFFEECEWRLLRYRHRAAVPDVSFSADDRSIKPYIPCLIADPAKEAIYEVILGPKHQTNISWMRSFLESIGLGHVRVRRSDHESYR